MGITLLSLLPYKSYKIFIESIVETALASKNTLPIRQKWYSRGKIAPHLLFWILHEPFEKELRLTIFFEICYKRTLTLKQTVFVYRRLYTFVKKQEAIIT